MRPKSRAFHATIHSVANCLVKNVFIMFRHWRFRRAWTAFLFSSAPRMIDACALYRHPAKPMLRPPATSAAANDYESRLRFVTKARFVDSTAGSANGWQSEFEFPVSYVTPAIT